MVESIELARARAEIAGLSKLVKDNPADQTLTDRLITARGEYAEMRIAECVERVVAAAPPLSPEQRDRLAILLRPEKQEANDAA